MLEKTVSKLEFYYFNSVKSKCNESKRSFVSFRKANIWVHTQLQWHSAALFITIDSLNAVGQNGYWIVLASFGL